MKHVFGMMLLICMVSSLFAADIRAAMGLDMMGESYSAVEAMQVGIRNQVGLSLSGQAVKTQNNFTYGFGIDFQLPRRHQSMPEGWNSSVTSAAYVPFYGHISYNFPEYRSFAPMFIAQLGYSIPIYDYWEGDDDDYYDEEYKYEADGGIYTGFGIGMRHRDLDLQLLYKVNRSTLTEKEYIDGELDYSFHSDYNTRQWNLSIGYRFRN